MRFLAVLLLLALLAVPAAAQNEAAVADFLNRLAARLDAGDGEGAIALVTQDPATALQTFTALGEHLAANPGDRETVGLVMNFIARVFQVRLGRSEPTDLLRQIGLLLPENTWDGTPLAQEAQGGDLMGEMESILQEGQAINRDLQALYQRQELAGRLENFAAVHAAGQELTGGIGARTDRMVARLDALIGQLEKSGIPTSAELVAQIKQLRDQRAQDADLARVLEVGYLTASGQATAAAAKGEGVLPRLTNPELVAAVHLFLVQAGRLSGQPDLTERHLKALDTADAEDRFFADTVAFELELQRNPDLPVERYLQEHDRVWPSLAGIPQIRSRYTAHAVRIWTMANLELASRLRAGDPTRKRLEEMRRTDLAAVLKRAEDSFAKPPLAPDGKSVNAEWQTILYFGLLDLHLDLAARARELGDAEEAKRELAAVATRLPRLEATARELEPVARAIYGSQPFDVRVGYLSRIPGRLHEERAMQAGSVSDFEAAVRLYTAAQATPSRLAVLPEYALALAAAGQTDRALKIAEEAVAESAAAGNRLASIASHMARGRIRADRAGAVADLKKAQDLLEAFVTESGPRSEVSRRSRVRARPGYERLVSLQVEGGDAAAAFDTVSRLQQVEGYGAGAPPASAIADPKVRGAAERVESSQARLRGLQQEADSLLAMADTPDIRSRRKATSELLAATREEFYRVLGDLYRLDKDYERLAIRPAVLGQAQTLLPAGVAVLQYFPSGEHLYIFALTRETMRIRRVPVPRAELEAKTRAFRTAMATVVRGLETGQKPAWSPTDPVATSLEELHGLLIEPAEEDLKGAQVVAVVPTGSLLYLPFQALARSRPDGTMEFLVERFQVATLVKASDLLQLAAPVNSPSAALAAFGNPDGTLPSAEQEVAALKALFPDGQVYVRDQATAERLRGLQGKVGLLHLATHGVLDQGEPEANHLVMAGGPLTVGEVAGLSLGPDARLVTLSACQTALSDPRPRSELLQSVADAFGYAGSPTVVASLWQVEDDSTRELMAEFYRRLKAGESRAGALQGAEKLLLARPETRHPFYWSPFVLFGDWR